MKANSITLLAAGLFASILISCNNNLISNLNTAEISVASKEIEAPSTVTATNGDNRSISITWNEVTNAKQYFIYSAISPFESFKKIGETNHGECEFKYTADAGKTLWFRINCVSYTGDESEMSDYFSGSTMAVPNITSITLSTDGTAATVNWWMSNCNEKTYMNDVYYKVTCYKDDKVTVVNTTTVQGNVTSATLSGLQKSSKYYYQVEAWAGTYKSEASDMADIETAKKTTPNAPEDVSVERGVNTKAGGKGISISWTLPEGVEYKTSQNNTSAIYEVHPLYFSIERKLSNQSDSDYTTLVPYIGSFNSSTDGIYFTCSETPSSSSELLTVDCTGIDFTTAEISNYAGYAVGSKLTYQDKNVEEGKIYTYRIRSYADDTGTKTISSDSSVAISNGWLITTPSLQSNTVMTKDPEDSSKFSQIDVSFDFDFEDNGLDEYEFYTYLFTKTRTAFPTDETPEPSADNEILIGTYSSKDAFENNSSECLDSTIISDTSKQGYYTYRIYICKEGTENLSDSGSIYTSAEIESPVTVTDDANKMPVISTFSVQDGYKDKYVLSWDYNSSYSYSIQWVIYKNDSPSGEKQSLDIDSSALAVSGGTATYTHSGITSGDERKYTLIAKSSLKATKEYETVSKTLGTAEINLESLAYDSLNIKWNAVQNAEVSGDSTKAYTVSAWYSDDTSKTLLNNDSNTTITYNSELNTYSCKIDKPEGYNSALKSGKAITIQVTSTNENTGDTTTGSAAAALFGPACINAEKGTLYEDSINIGWAEINGASGYVIYRVKYSDNTATTLSGAVDTYYLDSSTLKLKRNSESPKENGTSVSRKNGKLWLNDCDDSKYGTLNQENISWGLPYGYVIIPVLNDADDFEFDGTQVTDGGNSHVGYADAMSSKAYVVNASLGYGLNVTAAKAESTKTVEVTWDKPYANSVGVPYIYRRQNGTTQWTKLTSLSSTDNSYYDTLENADKTKAYYYAIQYHKSDADMDERTAYETHLEQMDKRYADGIETEQLNKGYLFYMNFSAKYNGTPNDSGSYKEDANYYSQKVCHTLWDFTERARGPGKMVYNSDTKTTAYTSGVYTIYAQNLNTTYDAIKIADVTVNLENGEETYSLNTTSAGLLNGDGDDTLLTRNGSEFVLAPKAMTEYLLDSTKTKATSTEGVLKVLRSTKTIYILDTSRTYQLSGKDEATVSLEQDTYAFRQISTDELAKCVGLIIADGIYQAGVPYYYDSDFITRPVKEACNTCSGNPGTFYISHFSWANYSQWGYDGSGYQHVFRAGTSSKYGDGENVTPTGKYSYVSEFTLTAGRSDKVEGCSSKKLYYLAPLDITVTHESGLDSYQGKINVTAGASGTSTSWNLTMKKTVDSTTVTIASASDETTFRSYLPFEMGAAHGSADNTINTNLYTYQNDWWK